MAADADTRAFRHPIRSAAFGSMRAGARAGSGQRRARLLPPERRVAGQPIRRAFSRAGGVEVWRMNAGLSLVEIKT